MQDKKMNIRAAWWEVVDVARGHKARYTKEQLVIFLRVHRVSPTVDWLPATRTPATVIFLNLHTIS